MSKSLLAEIKASAYLFVPEGWALHPQYVVDEKHNFLSLFTWTGKRTQTFLCDVNLTILENWCNIVLCAHIYYFLIIQKYIVDKKDNFLSLFKC